jgi:hypothetical protein
MAERYERQGKRLSLLPGDALLKQSPGNGDNKNIPQHLVGAKILNLNNLVISSG